MTLDSDFFPADTVDLLRLLEDYEVRYLVVGGRAVIYHAYVRTTGDTDILFDPSENNAERVYEVLEEFWNGNIPGIDSKQELLEPDIWLQFGYEPARIDLLNGLAGIVFEEVWERREMAKLSVEPPLEVKFISKKDLIDAKQAAGRDIDRADLKYLLASED